MSEPYIGEIRMFTYTFAPRGWAFCDGQLMSVSDQSSLYSVIGFIYGGNGKDTFALPDLRGRAPLPSGQPPGWYYYRVGQFGGLPRYPLSVNEIPQHSHMMQVTTDTPTERDPGGHYPAKHRDEDRGKVYVEISREYTIPFDQNAVGPAGSGAAHENMQPYLTVPFCIALVGVYPQKA